MKRVLWWLRNWPFVLYFALFLKPEEQQKINSVLKRLKDDECRNRLHKHNANQ